MAVDKALTVQSGEFHGFDAGQEEALKARLKEEHIKERPGAGNKKLKYISGDYAIATANRIFGFGKWGYRVLSKSRESVGDKEFYTADIELYVIGCPFPFPGEGVGVPQNSTVEQHEKARKEAVTDALKRALRHFGDQFGLSLYDEDNYIEADDGSDKKVKDVGKQPQTNGYQKRTVESTVARPQPRETAQSNGNGNASHEAAKPQNGTTKPLTWSMVYNPGKKAGKWADLTGFYKFVTTQLKREKMVEYQDMNDLTQDHLKQLLAAMEA